jgi:hypothetical protein
MRSASNEGCTENQNIHVITHNFFVPENRTIYDICRKVWWSQRRFKLQQGGALRVGLVNLHARKRTPVPVHPHTHVRMYTHAFIRPHIYTQKRVILFFHNNGSANAPQFYVIRILPLLLKYDWIITCHDSNSFDFLYVQIFRKFFTPQPNKRNLPIFNADGTREFVKLPDKILHLPEALLVLSFSGFTSWPLSYTLHQKRRFLLHLKKYEG